MAHILKNDEMFLLCDERGDVVPGSDPPAGCCFRDTRHLSRLEMTVDNAPPRLLSSAVEKGEIVVRLLTSEKGGSGILVEKRLTIVGDALDLRVTLRNFSPIEARPEIRILFASDFKDIFEIRGWKRTGAAPEPRVVVAADAVGNSGAFVATCRGNDGVTRTTAITIAPRPEDLTGDRMLFRPTIPPGETRLLCLTVTPCDSTRSPATNAVRLRDKLERRRREMPRITTSHQGLNDVIARACDDLAMLATITSVSGEEILHAGLPWYSAIFGRDSLISALFLTDWQPSIALGTLRTLAALQAAGDDPKADMEPGKIIHEHRYGAMAGTREVVFGRYYGSADATPLFLILLRRYYRRTGDIDTLRSLWGNALAAMRWIDRFGDGYVTYHARNPRGLQHQGWKDAGDAVMHEDGRAAPPPIALVEVQAYAEAARRAMAEMARTMEEPSLARRFAADADVLKKRFNGDFGIPGGRGLALALDGRGEPCRVLASNIGHALWAGIVDRGRAEEIVRSLLSPAMFTGYGVRTLAAGEKAHHPFHYHNGSVWPHDNAIIAEGFRRYGFYREASLLAGSMLEAAIAFPGGRPPELFAGLSREETGAPIPIPVACSPQAWASAAIFQFMQTILGFVVEPDARTARCESPNLPEWLQWVHIEGFPLQGRRTDIIVRRRNGDVEVL